VGTWASSSDSNNARDGTGALGVVETLAVEGGDEVSGGLDRQQLDVLRGVREVSRLETRRRKETEKRKREQVCRNSCSVLKSLNSQHSKQGGSIQALFFPLALV
jgi:hypothetical protein